MSSRRPRTETGSGVATLAAQRRQADPYRIETAVDRQHLARDVRGPVRGQKDDKARDIKTAEDANIPYLLKTDNPVVVPVNKTVKLIVTSDPDGIIHAWTIPQFGMKIDAIPGRLNETWFKATKEGVYYGQCSELCGKDHAFMPIAVRVVSKADFDAWVRAEAQRDDRLLLPSGEIGNLHDLYRIANKRLGLRHAPEDVVVLQ